MNANEMIGAVVIALGAIIGLFLKIYNALAKKTIEEHNYRTKQLEATFETNYEIRSLREMLKNITLSDEKQNVQIDKNKNDITEIKGDVVILEGKVIDLENITYKKQYVK